MRQIASVLATVLMFALAGVASPALAASGDAYKAKKAECKARAKTMNFGIHLVKKNRWVKDCIAGKHV